MIKYLPLVLAMTVTAAFASLFLKKASGKLNSLVTLLLNKDICREPVKVLYKTFKEKRNNGEFDLQI